MAGYLAAVAITVLFFVAPLACFDRPTPDCTFLCGENNACPDGYTCTTGVCKRIGAPPGTECDIGMPQDGGSDGGGDGATDGGSDGMMPDSMMPDSMPDSMTPDSMPDSMTADGMSSGISLPP